IELTIANAIVSRFVNNPREYLEVKEEVKEKVLDVANKLAPDHNVKIYVNNGDLPDEGVFYLTVTGTSAEHGDDGATGRGNRVNGLITPMRPMSLEATAGKNPVTHIGKIYNIASKEIAEQIYEKINGIKEVTVRLLGQIGRPINDPLIADVAVILESDIKMNNNIKEEINSIVSDYLDNLPALTMRILKGEASLY
ncbi:MAG: methionine adenosyltransferase, partial [Caldisphaera sp.]|nr:methionine adenosyltransferase [Caldisphaera sp.]